MEYTPSTIGKACPSNVVLTIEYGVKTITIGHLVYPSKMYVSCISKDGVINTVYLATELHKVYGNEMRETTAQSFNAIYFLQNRLKGFLGYC